MLHFTIKEDKCIECGLCAQDCPVGIIELQPKPIIQSKKEKDCLQCQHCLAICPTAALSILGKKPEDSISTSGEMPTPLSMSRLIKTRRSVRKYKIENLDESLIQELMQTASHAPTGHNDNAVMLSLIDNKEDLSQFRNLVYDAIKKAKLSGKIPSQYDILSVFQRMWENNGVDIIFRDAPHLIIASAPKQLASPEADCLITLSYFELFANTHQVGTLWNGMLKWVLNDIAPELSERLGIPKEHCIGYIMLFGKAAVKYARGIQSEGLHVNRIHFSESKENQAK